MVHCTVELAEEGSREDTEVVDKHSTLVRLDSLLGDVRKEDQSSLVVEALDSEDPNYLENGVGDSLELDWQRR